MKMWGTNTFQKEFEHFIQFWTTHTCDINPGDLDFGLA